MIWLAFTPGAGRSSKRVTTGPGCTATTSASMPKSFSFISTRRDSASSASAEYAGSRGGGSSSSFSGGSSPAFGGSNSGTCRSFSTRSLFCDDGRRRLDARRRTRGGLLLLDDHRFHARLLALAALRDVARGRASGRAASRRRARSSAPMRSMIVSHETPNASDSPAIQAASSNSVAPRNLQPDGETLPDQRADDAAGGLPQRLRIPVQRGEPAARDEHQHEAADAHGGVRARAAPRSFWRLRNSVQHDTPSITGNRNAGRPNRKNSTSAIQAPDRPDAVVDRPGSPVKEKPGSSGLYVASADEQHQRQHRKRDDGALAQAAGDGGGEAQARCAICAEDWANV